MNETSRFYSPDGKLLSEQPYSNNKPVGIGRQYYLSGALYRIERFDEEGLKHGLQEAFYEDGSMKTIEPYDHGHREGETILYWPNGQLKRRVFFARGRRVHEY